MNGKREPFRDGFRTSIERGQTVAIFQDAYGDALQTVTLCVTRSDDAAQGTDPLDDDIDAPLVGDLNYGTILGLEHGVQFDWVNGMLLTVPSGNISLRCMYPETIVPGVGASVNLKQQVGVLLTCGPRPPAAGSLPQARLTSRLGSLGAAGVALVPVPKRAHAVRLLTSRPNLYGSFRVGFSPAIALGRELYFLDPTDNDEMPLTTGTRAVTVTNNAAVATFLTLLWSLSL